MDEALQQSWFVYCLQHSVKDLLRVVFTSLLLLVLLCYALFCNWWCWKLAWPHISEGVEWSSLRVSTSTSYSFWYTAWIKSDAHITYYITITHIFVWSCFLSASHQSEICFKLVKHDGKEKKRNKEKETALWSRVAVNHSVCSHTQSLSGGCSPAEAWRRLRA